MRPPPIYREHVAKLPGFARRSDDSEKLLADLLLIEGQLDRLQDDLLENEMEVALEAERADKAEARVKWLTERLAQKGDYAASDPTPEEELAETVSGCLDALERGRTLPLIVVGDTNDSASELDQHLKSRTWGRKAWLSLKALQDYAEASAAGQFTGNFLSYCVTQPDGREVIATEWVAAGESESTSNNPRYRQARTFPVPTDVNPDGTVYMEEHIRLEKGSDPAPRLHFYDDTAGTGKVYVGYLGRHLPNSSTN